jgi:hypothetical protein
MDDGRVFKRVVIVGGYLHNEIGRSQGNSDEIVSLGSPGESDAIGR